MSMDDRPTRRVPVDELHGLIERLLMAAGADEKSAKAAAEGYLEADLRGHPMQGLDHLYSILPRLRQGKINGQPDTRVIREGEGFAQIDADLALGHYGGVVAVDMAVEKARTSGCCAVGLLNADDLFMLGYYADRLARAGMVGFVYTAAPGRRVRVTGGIDPVLGTNPFAIGVPTGSEHPVVLDSSISVRATGVLRIAGYYGDSIPEGLAIDKDGNPTTDVKAALAGALEPFGGPKGYGLGLCGALLAGPLIGALLGKKLEQALENPTEHERTRGHLFIAVDPAVFVEPTEFRRAVSAYLQDIKTSKKAPGFEEILVPGERGLRQRDESLEKGALIYESVWENTTKLAHEYGVSMPG